MANTTNFGWETPDDTDLVKDGAAAMRTLGNAIDTSLVDLKGGTTGQVLSKASNTDMDYTWVTQDDANAIQNSIVDAKGDIITATADNTPARLAVGTSGNTLVADSAAATGLAYVPTFFAGKNKIINGDFGIWQRGTSFNLNNATGIFTADRFAVYAEFSGGSITASRQTFTPGTAPVSGYEGQYFHRWNQTAGSTNTTSAMSHRIEDIRTFAGQTVTLSFWAKADATRTVTTAYEQYCGSGGSGYINGSIGSYSVTTSWQRFTTTWTVPSVSGKTLGASSYLQIAWSFPLNTTQTIDIWGVQLEAGSTATQFQTATGTIQGELAACQRYYWNLSGSNSLPGIGYYQSASEVNVVVNNPVFMRTTPTCSVTTGTNYYGIKANGTDDTFNDLTLTTSFASQNATMLFTTTNVSGTSGSAGAVRFNNASAKIEFSAEL